MTAKISEDCKIGSRRKITQVISVKREWEEGMEMRGCDIFRCCCFPLHCVCFSVKRVRMQQRTVTVLCKDASMCCMASMHSEKWWLYVNCARVHCLFVYEVVIKSFIKQTQPYHNDTSAASSADAGQLLLLCDVHSLYVSLIFVFTQLLIFLSVVLFLSLFCSL